MIPKIFNTCNITYRIECWNPTIKKYVNYWMGTDFERAMIMMNKSYYKRVTRRLIRVQEEIIQKAKANTKK